MSRSYIVGSQGSISLLIDSKQYSIDRDHPSYAKIRDGLTKLSNEELINLLDVKTAIKTNSGGTLEVVGNQIHRNGEPVHHVVADRLIRLLQEGFDITPGLKFLEKILKNPSRNSQLELYNFLDRRNITIDEDGDFRAYKAIRADWTDKHTGKISNRIGAVVRMDRCLVDDNKNVHCGAGLHVGGLTYVQNFAGRDDKIIIVKVNPEHAVSVPTDDAEKLRVCEYTVVDIFRGELTAALYKANENTAVDAAFNDWEDDEDESQAYNVCTGKYEDEDDDYEDDDYDDEVFDNGNTWY